jgi:hypothetical protein
LVKTIESVFKGSKITKTYFSTNLKIKLLPKRFFFFLRALFLIYNPKHAQVCTTHIPVFAAHTKMLLISLSPSLVEVCFCAYALMFDHYGLHWSTFPDILDTGGMQLQDISSNFPASFIILSFSQNLKTIKKAGVELYKFFLFFT